MYLYPLSYPGYQRVFSRVVRIFGVGRAGHYKDLTETGNRARKVSGTQGTIILANVENLLENFL